MCSYFSKFLKLNDIEAELLQLERKYMLRYVRNCGEVMVDLIERVQADSRSNKESV